MGKDKEEMRTYQKAYRLTNTAKIRACQQAWNLANDEKVKEYKKGFYLANKEKMKACFKKYHLANAEKLRAYGKVYYQANKEKHKEKVKAYLLANAEELSKRKKVYYQVNKDEIKEKVKTYTQTPAGKQVRAKSNSNRKQFGFIPLNGCFKGSDAHHINKEQIIYIPKELHLSIGHSLLQNRNMEKINARALEFLKTNALRLFY